MGAGLADFKNNRFIPVGCAINGAVGIHEQLLIREYSVVVLGIELFYEFIIIAVSLITVTGSRGIRRNPVNGSPAVEPPTVGCAVKGSVRPKSHPRQRPDAVSRVVKGVNHGVVVP